MHHDMNHLEPDCLSNFISTLERMFEHNTFGSNCIHSISWAVNQCSKRIWFIEGDGVWHELHLSQPKWSQQKSKVLQSCQLVSVTVVLVAYFPIIWTKNGISCITNITLKHFNHLNSITVRGAVYLANQIWCYTFISRTKGKHSAEQPVLFFCWAHTAVCMIPSFVVLWDLHTCHLWY